MSDHPLDDLVTRFVDGECSADERAAVIAHLRECPPCSARVEAESAARHMLQACAGVARTMGTAPAWRPRVFRLGQPALPNHSGLVLVAAVTIGLVVFWLRPTPVMAVGVIGDSACQQAHRFTARFGVDETECTLGCVARGAQFVLITDEGVLRIRNQRLPELTALANARVRVEGTIDGDQIDVDRIVRVEPGTDRPTMD